MTIIKNPWASSLDRSIECPPSCLLPKASSWSDAADRGIECHEFLEACAEGRRDEALAKVPPEYRDWCERIDVAKLFRGLKDIKVERVYALDVVRQVATELERRSDNNYTRPDTEFLGRCDVFAIDEDGTPVVADHKTGRDQGDPREAYQLRFFAAVAFLMTGSPQIRVRLNYIDEDGSVRIVPGQLGVLDHEETIATLANLRTRLLKTKEQIDRGEVPNVRSGDWCKYCPSFHVCPAKMGLVKNTMPELMQLQVLQQSDQLAYMTPEQLGFAWSKYKEMEQLLGKIKAVLEEAIEKPEYVAGLPLPNGKLLKDVKRTSKRLNQAKLIKLAEDAGVDETSIASCFTTNSYYVRSEVKK